LPVVNSQGVFKGLLTVDMIESSWLAESSNLRSPATPILKLMEAKDLVYRSGILLPTVRIHHPLSTVIDRFDDLPCIPVVGDDGKVLGLLFSFGVRLAYEREMARLSFLPAQGSRI
jgi:hypothetical protein